VGDLTNDIFYTTIVSTKSKGKPNMKQAINIRLEKDVPETLDGYAKELDKTRTSLVEKAIVRTAHSEDVH
jgi:uncharacterized protein (DUF1778 family)